MAKQSLHKGLTGTDDGRIGKSTTKAEAKLQDFCAHHGSGAACQWCNPRALQVADAEKSLDYFSKMEDTVGSLCKCWVCCLSTHLGQVVSFVPSTQQAKVDSMCYSRHSLPKYDRRTCAHVRRAVKPLQLSCSPSLHARITRLQ